MQDWFRDNLQEYNHLIGTYDSYKESYNLTLSNNSFSENLIEDSFLDVGEELENISVGSLSKITNPVPTGTSLEYLYEKWDVDEYENPANPFDWEIFPQTSYDLQHKVKVVHHAAIPKGALVGRADGTTNGLYAVEAVTAVEAETVATQWTTTVTLPDGTQTHYTGASQNDAITAANNAGYQAGSTVVTQQFESAEYEVKPGGDDGWWYDPGVSGGGFPSVSDDLFGPNHTHGWSTGSVSPT
jgi:hypothetical protein